MSSENSRLAEILLKVGAILALIIGVPAFFMGMHDGGFFAGLVNGAIFGGMVFGFFFVMVVFMADVDTMNRPARSREEKDRRDVDALMGYVATDDKAWHDLWDD